LLIRIATEADEEELTRLDVAGRTAQVSPVPDPGAGYRFFARVAPEDTLVAEVNGAIVGNCAVATPAPVGASPHVLEIIGLDVRADHRRRGIAIELITAAKQLARERGKSKLVLRVLGSNPAAYSLYEREGFEVEGVLREHFELEGRRVDDYLMAHWVSPES
jgi:ribosomal protein S18 acetylase RimI-like enzyme